MGLNRRQFTLGLAATGLVPTLSARQQRPRLVVVGAGVGGLGFIQTLHERLPADALDVTVIEPQQHYHPPFGSARVLAGIASIADWRRNYPALPGVRWRQQRVTGLDAEAQRLSLADGSALDYDYLLLAPGVVASEQRPGADHLAWFNDASLERLLQRLDALPPKAEILLCVPQLPYRCPPAPYERAGLMLRYLRDRGREDVHLSILDAKSRFAQQARFLSDWEQRWPGRINWLPPDIHDGIGTMHADRVETGFGDFAADLLQVIPPQAAPDWCRAAGVADFTGYCRVQMPSLRSRRSERIYVVGDAAAAGAMPKSASAALSQARLAAADLAHRIADLPIPPVSLSSQCFSRLDRAAAISSVSEYAADGSKRGEVSSPYGQDTSAARREHAAAEAWYQQMLLSLGFRS